MITAIHNYLRGSVEVRITGAAIERLLNLCAIHDVAFWNVRTVAPDCFIAWVSVAGYFRIRPYAHKTGCRVRVCRKRGVPFTARRLARRWALWGCALLCAACIWYLSGFVWTIQVLGCQRTTQREILALLGENGLTTGARRAALDPRNIRNAMLITSDKLSYLTVNFKGTQAVVQVWEREITPEQVQEDIPCDVVSELTGVVQQLRVRTGVAVAQKGQMLQPGDPIATGVVTSALGDTRLVHTVAEADIRTWYTIRTAVPTEIKKVENTENSQIRRFLVLGSRRIPLDLIEKPSFAWYDKIIRENSLSLQENFRWPIALVSETCRECTEKSAVIDETALSSLLEERMLERLKRAKPQAEIISAQFTVEHPNGAFVGVLKVELLETTGKEVPIQ